MRQLLILGNEYNILKIINILLCKIQYYDFLLGACSTDSKVKNFQENEINLPEDRLERLNYAELASDNHKIAKMNSDRCHYY